MDLDVKRIMLKLLETQKEYALADLENYSEAMVAVFTADGKSYVTFPKFSGEVAKIAEYTAIVERARESGAVLLITVNAGWTKVVKAASELGDYRWGELGPHNSQRCLQRAVLGFKAAAWNSATQSRREALSLMRNRSSFTGLS
jgi:hypothetical protein